jgi:hypothetical protein
VISSQVQQLFLGAFSVWDILTADRIVTDSTHPFLFEQNL